MFSGDKSKPAADASYRNLIWENFHVDHSFDFGTKIQSNKEIGTIDSWGPFFRVSFDLIIHSLRHFATWTSLLDFHAYGTICEHCAYHRVPVLYLNSRFGVIMFGNTFVRSGSDKFLSDKFLFKIELNHWYNIIIEHRSVNGKVREVKKRMNHHQIYFNY